MVKNPEVPTKGATPVPTRLAMNGLGPQKRWGATNPTARWNNSPGCLWADWQA
jgi:hypothetical protein